MWCNVASDVRFAARRLAATPLFTVFAVVSLAVGVGLTVAVYSVVDAVLLRELGIANPERVVVVASSVPGQSQVALLSDADFDTLLASQRSFLHVAASLEIFPSIESAGRTEMARGEAVSAQYFAALGVRAAAGRMLDQTDDDQAARVAVISYRLWRTGFASDRHILGKPLLLSGSRYEIVGVVSDPFEGTAGWLRRTAVWIPLSAGGGMAPGGDDSAQRLRPRLSVVARLRADVTNAIATSEVGRLAGAIDADRPGAATRAGEKTRRLWHTEPLSAAAQESTTLRRIGYGLIGLVALVLVVACTNLSNLMLARGAARRQESAVRRALGASRLRLVCEQLAESVVLTLAGAAAAVLVVLLLRVLWNGDIPVSRNVFVPVTPRFSLVAVAVAVGAVLLSLVVFGLEPALNLTRTRDIRGELAGGTGNVTRRRSGRQTVLLRWQVAVSAGFFIIATLCVRHTMAEAMHDPGIDLDRLAVGTVDFATLQWDSGDLPKLRWNEDRGRHTVDRIIAEMANEREAMAAALSTGLPFGTPAGPLTVVMRRPDAPATGGGTKTAAIAAAPSLFRTLGIPIVKGRAFDGRDDAGTDRVIVLSQRTARTVFGTSDALGRQVELTVQPGRARAGSWLVTVVGIARDTDVRELLSQGEMAYLPLAQFPSSLLTVTVRGRGDAHQAVAALVRAVKRADASVALTGVGTGRTVLAGLFVLSRKLGILALTLGCVTMLLAMVGLYGVQSQMVALRTGEMGIRMSLGALPSHIKLLVLGEGCRPVVEGLLIGLALGFAGRAVVRAYVVTEVSVVDPWVLAFVPLPLLCAALLACYLPARRAALVDPNVALRSL